jgi:hypothetical protein
MNLDGLKDTFGSFRGFAADTTFVLFFLGLEAGRSLQSFAFDVFLLFVTMLMVAVLPFYLPSDYERPEFGRWLAGRGAIAMFATLLGAVFNTAYGNVLPESFRYLPLSLLILAATASCLVEFYALMRLRPAK